MDDRRLKDHWLVGERIRVYPWLVLVPFAVFMAVWTALSLPDLIDPRGKPVGYDFIAFWSAARLAVEGPPEAAYDWAAIAAVHRIAVPALRDFICAWHYPPTFLLVVLPLGLLSYLPALGIFLAANVAFAALLIRRMFADPRAWAVAAAFPAGLFNLGAGQNGLVTAGLAGFALLALDRRPVLAGILIGLLAVKPHLALLFPVALIAAGRWRSFVAAAATALGFTGLSIAVFGWATMQAFLNDLATVRWLIDAGALSWGQIPSLYATALSFGVPPASGMVLHAVGAGTAVVCVWLAWHAKAAPVEAKMATLAAGSLLVSPYVFFYDLTWIGLAIGWLAILGMRIGFRPGEREMLLATWVTPGLIAPIYAISGLQVGFIAALLLTVAGTLHALRPDPIGSGARLAAGGSDGAR